MWPRATARPSLCNCRVPRRWLPRNETARPLGDGPFSSVVSVTAGELLAERLERLVGGERAGLGVGLDVTAGGVRRGLAGLDLGLLGLLLLFDVSLPAGVSLGVLLLPDPALLVEALEPLPGLRVEALGV